MLIICAGESLSRQFCHLVAAGDILSSAPYGWFILLSFGIFVAADMLASRRWDTVPLAPHSSCHKVLEAVVKPSVKTSTSRMAESGFYPWQYKFRSGIFRQCYRLEDTGCWLKVDTARASAGHCVLLDRKKSIAAVLICYSAVLMCHIVQRLSFDASVHCSVESDVCSLSVSSTVRRWGKVLWEMLRDGSQILLCI